LSSGGVDCVEFDNGVASSGSFFIDAGERSAPATTPEPATLGCGMSGLAWLLWRRRGSR
jgi:hypothetical protein